MDIKAAFFNQSGRLRSGWRFSIYLLSCFFAILFFLSLGVAVMSALPRGFSPKSIQSYLLQFTVSFAAAVFFGWLYGRFFEDLPFRALGAWFTKNWLRDLASGLLIGALSLCFAALIAWAAGGIGFQYNDSAGSSAVLLTLLTSLLIFIAGAAFEEAFLRGYPLQTFSRAGLALFGTVLTSLIFATLHNGNPSANPLSWFNTFLAGIWLAAAYLKTRNLWFPFGIHLTWNWFQGSILGINVSGLQELTTSPLLRATDFGPAWLTGAGYGLEGGIACTIALIVSTAVIWFLPFLEPSDEMLALTSGENERRQMAGSQEK